MPQEKPSLDLLMQYASNCIYMNNKAQRGATIGDDAMRQSLGDATKTLRTTAIGIQHAFNDDFRGRTPDSNKRIEWEDKSCGTLLGALVALTPALEEYAKQDPSGRQLGVGLGTGHERVTAQSALQFFKDAAAIEKDPDAVRARPEREFDPLFSNMRLPEAAAASQRQRV